MKKLIFMAAILFSCVAIQKADAQVRVSLGLNINSQPEWGPVGYNHAEYYYMPDIDTYYDVPNHQYVYYENNVWIHNRVLPQRFGNYDRYHSYKVVVNQRNPWERDDQMRQRYSNYRGRRDQVVIRDSRDDRYRNHWRDDNRDNRDNRGNGYGNRGNDNRGNGYGNRGNDNRGNDHRDNGNGKDHGDNGNGHDRGHGHGNGN
jgi:hypothetical protein